MAESSLANKIVWVTGASSGIGASLTAELCRRGARVAATSRNEEKLNALAKLLLERGCVLRTYPGDVGDLQRMKEIASTIEVEMGALDILVANAGSHLFTRPLEFDSGEYQRLMDLNYGGVLHCIEAVLPAMLRRRSGRICGVASLAGYRALPRAAAYGASKAALIHFLESVRYHLEREGIEVTIVNPGFVKTPLTDKNDFPMPFLIDSDNAARLIANGLEQGRREINFPATFAFILRIARILPYRIYDWIVMRLWRRLGYK